MVHTLTVVWEQEGREVRESVVVDDLGDGRYRLLRSPGVLGNLAAGDLFELDPDDGLRVLERGGNLSVQVSSATPLGECERFLAERLVPLGGYLDGREDGVVVFTVPASAGFPALDAVLREVEARFPGCVAAYGNVTDDDDAPLDWWSTPRMSDDEYRALVEEARQELEAKARTLSARYRLDRSTEYAWNLGEGALSLGRDGGMLALAEVEVVGTYSRPEQTWLWAWANPAVPPAARRRAEQVIAYGHRHGIDRLTRPKLAATFDEARELVALACRVIGGAGGLSDENDGLVMWMLLADVRPIVARG